MAFQIFNHFMPKQKIITGLDIGTYSIKALTVSQKPDSDNLEVLGKVESPSFGTRRGIVIKIDDVSRHVGEALRQLQQITGQKIEDVYVNIGGSHIFCTCSRGTVIVSRADQKISEEDVNRVVRAAEAFSLPSNKEILEVFPKEFIVDGEKIKEPRDMQGLRLEVDVLALCGFSPYLKNLTSAVLGAGFQVSDVFLSALASAKAVLSPRQKELGVCVLDIGAGTTDLIVYEGGDLVHAAVLPIGSERITYDLAVGLKTDVEIAEKIKQEFGSCLLQGSDKKERIEIPQDSGSGSEFLTFSHKMLVKIIVARVSEIFSLAEKELKNISPQNLLPAGIVLTGGGAKLPKIVELAKKELKLPVRIGLAQGLEGLERDASLSTVCGLVLSANEIMEDRGRRPKALSTGITAKLKKAFKVFLP